MAGPQVGRSMIAKLTFERFAAVETLLERPSTSSPWGPRHRCEGSPHRAAERGHSTVVSFHPWASSDVRCWHLQTSATGHYEGEVETPVWTRLGLRVALGRVAAEPAGWIGRW